MAKNLAVDTEKCEGCMRCMEVCPVGAITLKDGKAHISDACQLCLQCAEMCEHGAL